MPDDQSHNYTGIWKLLANIEATHLRLVLLYLILIPPKECLANRLRNLA